MEDITSCPNNRDILQRIKDNDPTLTRLRIVEMDDNGVNSDGGTFFLGGTIFLSGGNDLGWLGYYIGENETLLGLDIHYLPAQEQVEIFFIGLQRNESIKSISFDGSLVGTLGEGLSAINLPHVTNMKLDFDLDYEEGDFPVEEARHFAVGLQRFKSLVSYWGPVTPEIAASLIALPMLESVYFKRSIAGTEISPDECAALSCLLSSAKTMNELCLSVGGIGNGGLAILAEGLASNTSLTDGLLDLSYNLIGDEGLQALAASLVRNTKLRELKLSNNLIGDAGLEALAGSLVDNRTLRKLSLSSNTEISVTGVRSVSQILQSGTSGLEYLDLDEINISDEGGNMLADTLSVNNSLVSLSLRGVSIGDDGLRALALGLTHNTHLKFLDLSGNSAITSLGLRSLEEYLGSPSCALKELNLYRINIGDEGAQALADSLRRNKSLSSLSFDERGITLIGWRSFLTLVCDSSSPNRLYLSNQTLCQLGRTTRLSGSDGKDYVGLCLEINKLGTLAAKIKILLFLPDLDMVPLLQWNLKFLPLLKHWLEVFSTRSHENEARICNFELSSIYKFVRGLSVLVVDELRGRVR